MRKNSALIVVLAFLAALGLTAYSEILSSVQPIDSIAAIEHSNGQTVLARYEKGRVILDKIGADGVTGKSVSFPRLQKNVFYSIADIAMEPDGQVLLLVDARDKLSGQSVRQELWQYDMGRFFPRRVRRISFEDDRQKLNWRWMEVSSGLLIRMATDPGETVLRREAYDLKTLLADGGLTVMGDREFKLQAGEGVIEAKTNGKQVLYSSRSGKLFAANEGSGPVELYSALKLQKYSYPMYIAPQADDTALMGVWESGDILQISTVDGSSLVVKAGTEPFSGVSSYRPIDVRAMSMIGIDNFSAVISSETGFALVLCTNGVTTVVEKLASSLPAHILLLASGFLLRLAACLAVGMLLLGLVHLINESRTIIVKLIVATIPLMTAALALFCVFSYQAYSQAIEDSFKKQAEDEGSLLTALFGVESFRAIEFPYQYSGEDYRYLQSSMATRSIFTSTAYYENGVIYTGVDPDFPSAFPYDGHLNRTARSLYERAAYTGKSQTGIIEDNTGRRLACVTPIGGEDGGIVYLLETGIFAENMQQYLADYLRRFVLVSALFLLAVGGILSIIFLRIVHPLKEIKLGLETFAQGDRKIRLADRASDEFSDITRVFNKMANDIDTQIYNLQQANETYFRFIPQKMLLLLGKENLGEVELGNHRALDCCIVNVTLTLRSGSLGRRQEQDQINRFFNIINLACDQNECVLISDSANLNRLRVLCPKGGETAVRLSIAALAQIDSYNASLPVQNRLDVLFVVHKMASFYGICGDHERLIPALLSEDDILRSQADDFFHSLSSRLIVTASAMPEIDGERHFYRFIGSLDIPGCEDLGLYDFYDAAPPEETRLINETLATFNKAIELYGQNRYYDAKNMFALVLRQNQYDNVARHYVFRSEKKL